MTSNWDKKGYHSLNLQKSLQISKTSFPDPRTRFIFKIFSEIFYQLELCTNFSFCPTKSSDLNSRGCSHPPLLYPTCTPLSMGNVKWSTKTTPILSVSVRSETMIQMSFQLYRLFILACVRKMTPDYISPPSVKVESCFSTLEGLTPKGLMECSQGVNDVLPNRFFIFSFTQP